MSDNTNFVYNIVATSNLSGTFGSAWDENVSQTVVDDALLNYGVSSEAEMTDEKKKRALLNYYTWSKIRDMLLITPSSYKTDGESFTFDKGLIEKRVAQAKAEAMPYLSAAQIQVGRISFPDDPYSLNGQVEHSP